MTEPPKHPGKEAVTRLSAMAVAMWLPGFLRGAAYLMESSHLCPQVLLFGGWMEPRIACPGAYLSL